MKKLAIAGMVLALAGSSGFEALAKNLPTRPNSNTGVITISCYRGPWGDVIWDRPNAVFIEDLVRIGYSYPQAHAIGERVCRDEYGVNQHDYLRNTLYEIMAKTPPGQ